MNPYPIKQAEHDLKNLLVQARNGETIIIIDEDENAVQLVPITIPKKPRQPGSAEGLIIIHDNFDDPLDDFDDYQ
jgi:antitoxin (DNA-binding transcriptional repressor) of toxin-antitoxin stability system